MLRKLNGDGSFPAAIKAGNGNAGLVHISSGLVAQSRFMNVEWTVEIKQFFP